MRRSEKLKRLYDKIPKIKCQMKCAQACGALMMSDFEKSQIVEHVGSDPFPQVEDVLQQAINTKDSACLTCPLLKEEKCTVYEMRPLVCRLYGVVKKLQCPYGCVPDEWLTDQDAHQLIKQANKL